MIGKRDEIFCPEPEKGKKSKRGGVRHGSGRPALGDEKLVTISGKINEKLRMRVEFEAKKNGVTVSEYIREALKEKIKYDEVMDKLDENKKDGHE